MEEILKINNVDDYNKLYGLETRHPLVHSMAHSSGF